MVSTGELTYASGLRPEDLSHWRDLISVGSGFTRIMIPQRRRRPREVLMPSVGLDRVLKQLRIGLMKVSGYVEPEHVHGFVTGRDIATNASQHLNQDVVLKVDLMDFFGTIDLGRLSSALGSLAFDERCSEAVAGVCLVENSLAQGFSTSPILSNIAFLETDRELAEAAAEVGIRYTRYVDDMTFSGSRSRINDDLLDRLDDLLMARGWMVNHRKTRFMRRGKPQYVTGLYVGDINGPHIPRSMKRLLRREVYFASRFGISDSHARSPTPIQADRLGGWVHYAAHVDPIFGERLRRLWQEVPSGRQPFNLKEDWDRLLEDIGFPADW